MLDFISTVCLIYICYKISDPVDFTKYFKKKEYKDPWRRQWNLTYENEKINVSVGDLVRWKYWDGDLFEGPQPVGLVIKLHNWYHPPIAEVLYTNGVIQHESTHALEIVLPKAD